MQKLFLFFADTFQILLKVPRQPCTRFLLVFGHSVSEFLHECFLPKTQRWGSWYVLTVMVLRGHSPLHKYQWTSRILNLCKSSRARYLFSQTQKCLIQRRRDCEKGYLVLSSSSWFGTLKFNATIPITGINSWEEYLPMVLKEWINFLTQWEPLLIWKRFFQHFKHKHEPFLPWKR